MNKVQDAQDAALYFMDLLVKQDGSIKSLITQAAIEYDLSPAAVQAWVSRSFPSNQALENWRKQQSKAESQKAIWEAELRETETAANDWAQGVWRNCEPDGEPGWDYCCDRFLEANAIQKENLRIAARKIFQVTGQRYEKARLLYLSNKESTTNAKN